MPLSDVTEPLFIGALLFAILAAAYLIQRK